MTRKLVVGALLAATVATACSSESKSDGVEDVRRKDASADTDSGGGEPLDARPLTDADLHPTCLLDESSTLPHVRLSFTSTKCVFTLAEARAGITITYDLIVDEDVSGFMPMQAYPYGPNVSVLNVTEELKGGEQAYCVCDLGLPWYGCPLDDGGVQHSGCGPSTIRKGTYHRVFKWDGRNWSGPSDYTHPEGPPFPADDYTLDVASQPGRLVSGDGGTVDAGSSLSVSGSFLVRLIP